MLLALMGQGTREEYWVLGEPNEAQLLQCATWFERLTEPQFPSREYEESAGINTGSGAPSR